MSEVRSSPNLRRRYPWGLVGMVALVLIGEIYTGFCSPTAYDVDESAYRWTLDKASHQVQQCEILCFGDSLTKLNVVPQIIQEQTGRQTFNLAISGSQAPSSYVVLKRAIDAGAKPVAVVVDFTPPLLRVGPRHNLTRWPVELDLVETIRLARWAGDPSLIGEVALARVFPTLRGRLAIRSNIMDALGGLPGTIAVWGELGLRNWQVNRGAQLMEGSAGSHGLSEADIVRISAGYYPLWQCHPANFKGINRFLSLAQQHQIQVFWVLPPLLPALHDQIIASGVDAQHQQFVQSWQARFPDLVVLDGRKKVLDLDAFWDPQHLSIAGATAFSRILGIALSQSIAHASPNAPKRDRWVSLPRFGLGPAVPGVESIDQSRVAIQASTQVRR